MIRMLQLVPAVGEEIVVCDLLLYRLTSFYLTGEGEMVKW